MALAHLGDAAIVQRNVHSSVIDGLVLNGMRPFFVAPELDVDMGVAHCLTPAALERSLAKTPDAVAVFAVSPTYFGAVADIAALAEVAHAHGVPLVVDESWGAHLAFSDAVPANALACGADVVLNSVHKLGGSLTQSAVVHVASERLDERVLDRSVTLVESTSPSGLLTASLDAARSYAATEGPTLLPKTVAGLAELREQIRAIKGMDVLDESIAEHASVFAWDPLRLTIDVRRTGVTGHAIATLMQERHNIWFELYAENVVVAVFGIGEDIAASGARLLAGLRDASDELNVAGEVARRAVRSAAALGADGDDTRAPRSSGPPNRSASTQPRAGSRPSRSRPTRPACQTCCPANG